MAGTGLMAGLKPFTEFFSNDARRKRTQARDWLANRAADPTFGWAQGSQDDEERKILEYLAPKG